MEFLSIYSINFIINSGILTKLINRSVLDKDDIKKLCILSFNGGIAQNNAGSGICHALAHAAEEMTGLTHTQCISFFCNSTIRFLGKYSKTYNEKFADELSHLIELMSEIIKVEEDLKALEKIVSNDSNINSLIERAKKDPCWRLFKGKINENHLISELRIC